MITQEQIEAAKAVLKESVFEPSEVWLSEDDARSLGINVDALLAEQES